MVQTRNNPIVQEFCFPQEVFFAIQGQYSVVQWWEAKEHSLIVLTVFKHVALLKGMLYVNNTAYIVEILTFPKGVLLL